MHFIQVMVTRILEIGCGSRYYFWLPDLDFFPRMRKCVFLFMGVLTSSGSMLQENRQNLIDFCLFFSLNSYVTTYYTCVMSLGCCHSILLSSNVHCECTDAKCPGTLLKKHLLVLHFMLHYIIHALFTAYINVYVTLSAPILPSICTCEWQQAFRACMAPDEAEW